MNCDECGGRCCTMMAMPPMTTLDALRTAGVPVKPESLFYASLHRGVTVRDGLLFLDADTPVVGYNGRLGRFWIAAAPCMWLEHGRCAHYEQRPNQCRAFDRKTASAYLVPDGCWCDEKGTLGEDFSEVVRLAKERALTETVEA